MALQSARNLAVKIRVFYKTGLPGSAHRATPVLRSLTSPLCRSTNERFRSSWHGRPSARIPYPSSPSPRQHVPSRFLFLDRVRGNTDPIQSIRRPKKTHLSPPFAPSPHVVPSASELYKSGRNVPSGSRYARHTIHGDLPCFFTGCITLASPPASSPPPLPLHPPPACSSVPSLAPSLAPSLHGPLHSRSPAVLCINPPRTISGRHPAAGSEPKIDRSGKDYRPCAMWP